MKKDLETDNEITFLFNVPIVLKKGISRKTLFEFDILL